MSSLPDSHVLDSTWASSLNPLTKMLMGTVLTTLLIIETDINIALLELSVVLILTITIFGLKWFLSSLRSLWMIILLAPLSVFIFSFTLDLTGRLNLSLLVLIKMIGILFSFSPMSRTVTPNELFATLIALKFPPTFSWIVVSTYRQAIFFIEELRLSFMFLTRDIPTGRINRLRYLTSSASNLLIIAYGRAIIRSKDYTETLMVRGWKGAHKDIPLDKIGVRGTDVVVIFILLLYLGIMFVPY